jgi:MinD superfamily P-loop ATPase
MKELVVISGKGGTGKTSVTASFAVLANRPVIVDCDVDAADLHLLLSPQIREQHEFISGHHAAIRQEDCNGCGVCQAYCRFDAVRKDGNSPDKNIYCIDSTACEGCGVCVHFCPKQAIDFPQRSCGVWMISKTRCGPMVHARLGIAAENSGKLVTTLRREASSIAEKQDRSLILVDGPPGIGCPVIASMTGASMALIVTEPTLSGEHDLQRILSLARHFKLPAAICVNKWDINVEMTERIENKACEMGAQIAGRIRYDSSITRAQMQEQTVVETTAPCVQDIKNLWDHLNL